MGTPGAQRVRSAMRRVGRSAAAQLAARRPALVCMVTAQRSSFPSPAPGGGVMINLSDRIPAHYSRRARTELSAAWEHLLTAAQDTARQVADTSRARGSVARERAALARLALRGELPTS